MPEKHAEREALINLQVAHDLAMQTLYCITDLLRAIEQSQIWTEIHRRETATTENTEEIEINPFADFP